MSSSDIDLEFFRKFADSQRVFSLVYSRAKKLVVMADEEDFIEEISGQLMEGHDLSEDDAEEYARRIYTIWQDKAMCSVTAFDQEMKALKRELSEG